MEFVTENDMEAKLILVQNGETFLKDMLDMEIITSIKKKSHT